jgi:hypothetical protein
VHPRQRLSRNPSVGLVLILTACAAEAGVETRRVPPSDPAAALLSIFLLGDAGGPAAGADPVLAALAPEVDAAHGRALVIFLGDNIYPNGLPAEDARERAEAERRLDAQLDVVRAADHAEGILIAGNHDWTFAGDGGWAAVRRQAAYAETRGDGRIAFLPANGCPGPVARDFEPGLRVIALDTEWWLYGGVRPVRPDPTCPEGSEEEVLASLRSMLADSDGRRVIVIGHHPVLSGGPHGGFFGWDQHLFPLRDVRHWLWLPVPVLGSIYPLARRYGVSQEDAAGYKNRRLRASLAEIFRERPPLLYAAGHDHNLQVLEDVGARYQVVSGAGFYGHTEHVARLDNTLYAARASGWVRIDVQDDGRIRLGVVEIDAGGVRTEPFSIYLEER